MKYLVVGLGNPGDQYQGTRHNLGFDTADKIAQSLDIEFTKNSKLKSEISKSRIGENEVIVIKPQTYMNLSGEAVRAVADYYEVKAENILIISDDTNLEIGQIRVRLGGEAGGHNGLKSVMCHVADNFWRIRLGVGSDDKIALEDFVLQRFNQTDREIVDDMIDKTAEYVVNSISSNKIENETIN